MTKKTVLGMPSCYFYADQLIAIGSVILIAGMFNEFINSWLKIVGCRPRYRYLITLEDPASEYKNWWEMIPYLKDESFFRSWPSGHMTKATIMLTLPPRPSENSYFMWLTAIFEYQNSPFSFLQLKTE